MNTAEKIDELLLRWDDLREQGQELSAEDLCGDCPELIEEVRRRIRALRAMYDVPNSATLVEAGIGLAPRPVPQIPGYEILGLLGSGGMGVVYQARQVHLKRTVALKMILSGGHALPDQVSRFRAEAEAAARLQHPNIVQIYEIGEKDGVPYLALEYIGGGSLAQRLDGKPLPPRLAAELVRTLALAIQHAHERGIIHRDLKPGNVLLAVASDQWPVARKEPSLATDHWSLATPKIADFGLAKRLDVEGTQTRTGTVLGTPYYMAPEQALGSQRNIGPATDVYALGAMLYEMLTGRPPFEAATVLEVLEQVRSHAPTSLRTLQPDVPADLETICLKCLQKETQERYPSALALADDLGRFLQGEPIQARGLSLLGQLTRLLNRQERLVPSRPANIGWLYVCAPLPFLFQLVLFIFFGGAASYGVVSLVLTLVAALCVISAVAWIERHAALVQPVSFNRQLWSARIALLTGMVATVPIVYLTAPGGRPWDPLAVYPFWTVLTGVTFFGVGGAAWGRLYLLALLLMAAAVAMCFALPWAALSFGLLLSFTVGLLVMHMRRLAKEEKARAG